MPMALLTSKGVDHLNSSSSQLYHLISIIPLGTWWKDPRESLIPITDALPPVPTECQNLV